MAYPRDVSIDEDNREDLLKQAAVKVFMVALTVAVVVAIGTWLMVKALGLSDTSSDTTIGGAIEPVRPLPTTALPVPSESIPGATDSPAQPEATTTDGLALSASPLSVGPMERINLTGSWAGQDNVTLSVQRLEDGSWTDFGVQATVRVGTYETYVMTGREGENQFRVYDPTSDTASNPVTVNVG